METNNYKETAVAGTQWQRAVRVVIDNPYRGIPSINFVEETAISLGEDDVITRLTGNLTDIFDPAKTFPLKDPDTGADLGREVSYGEIYVILNSLYRKLAADRDTAAEPKP